MVFVYGIQRGDGWVWNCIHTPTTNIFECENEQAYRSNCEMTAKYIEDVLFNADHIIEELSTPLVPRRGK